MLPFKETHLRNNSNNSSADNFTWENAYISLV